MSLCTLALLDLRHAHFSMMHRAGAVAQLPGARRVWLTLRESVLDPRQRSKGYIPVVWHIIEWAIG
jgi:hypothetical protein